jgi:serine/threonine protein kinase
MSPEILQNQQHGPEVDWWALGVLIFELLVGDLPFKREPGSYVPTRKAVTMTASLGLSQPCHDFVQGLLRPDLRFRLGARGDRDVKHHSWLADVDWERLLRKQITPPVLPPRDNHQPISPVKDKKTDRADQDFRDFSVYHHGNDMSHEEKVEQQRRIAKQLVTFLGDSTDAQAVRIARDCIEADAIFFLQGREVIGIQGYLDYRKRLREAFADLSLQVRSIRAELTGQTDRVAVKWTLRGRPRTSGNPKVQTFHGINMYQFNGLFVTSAMNSYDVLSAIGEADANHSSDLEVEEAVPPQGVILPSVSPRLNGMIYSHLIPLTAPLTT